MLRFLYGYLLFIVQTVIDIEKNNSELNNSSDELRAVTEIKELSGCIASFRRL
jgi:hypothetical protein